jgi:hypothetical protein
VNRFYSPGQKNRHYSAIYFVWCGICLTQKQKPIFEEFIKSYLYKVEIVLKIDLYLLDVGSCVAFTVSFEN